MAGVAQSVERVALTKVNLKVAGSSPAFGCYVFGIFFRFWVGGRELYAAYFVRSESVCRVRVFLCVFNTVEQNFTPRR
jgi:hypothetical protein